jgi:hypothetical protein
VPEQLVPSFLAGQPRGVDPFDVGEMLSVGAFHQGMKLVKERIVVDRRHAHPSSRPVAVPVCTIDGSSAQWLGGPTCAPERTP